MITKSEIEIVEKALATLGEHFDSVELLLSRGATDGDGTLGLPELEWLMLL